MENHADAGQVFFSSVPSKFDNITPYYHVLALCFTCSSSKDILCMQVVRSGQFSLLPTWLHLLLVGL